MPALLLALVAAAAAQSGSFGFQVVAWSRTGDEVLLAEVGERSSTPSLCFLDVSSGESSTWLSPLACGTLAAGAPSVTCSDDLARLNGELLASGFELAVNPDFCDGTGEPLFTNLGALRSGADFEQPIDSSFPSALFNTSYFKPYLFAWDDVVQAPAHPGPDLLPTLRAHRSADAPHGLIVVGGTGRPHVVDLFYSASGKFDDARRPQLYPKKLALHPPVPRVNLGSRIALAEVGLLLLIFAVVLQFRRTPPRRAAST